MNLICCGGMCSATSGARLTNASKSRSSMSAARQTYFGALNYCTREFLVKAYPKGNSEFTIEFLKYLKAQYPQRRLALFWDGTSASIALMNSKLTCNRSMLSQRQTLGKSPALSLLPMRQSRIQWKTSGYRRNVLFEGTTICANPLLSSNFCLSS